MWKKSKEGKWKGAPPRTAPKATIVAGNRESHRSFTLREYCHMETVLPKSAAVLFVPKATGMERPGRQINTAGNWISPPPPTIESKKPAKNAATQRKRISTA